MGPMVAEKRKNSRQTNPERPMKITGTENVSKNVFHGSHRVRLHKGQVTKELLRLLPALKLQ